MEKLGELPSSTGFFHEFFIFLGILGVEGKKMSLEKRFVRDGRNRVIASVTSGFSGGEEVVRDENNRIVGRTSPKFHVTRDLHNNLVSLNTADAGLLIKGKK